MSDLRSLILLLNVVVYIVEEHLPQFTTEVHGKTVNCATLRSSLEDLQTKISLKNYDVVCCHGDINAENCIFNKAESKFLLSRILPLFMVAQILSHSLILSTVATFFEDSISVITSASMQE